MTNEFMTYREDVLWGVATRRAGAWVCTAAAGVRYTAYSTAWWRARVVGLWAVACTSVPYSGAAAHVPQPRVRVRTRGPACFTTAFRGSSRRMVFAVQDTGLASKVFVSPSLAGADAVLALRQKVKQNGELRSAAREVGRGRGGCLGMPA